jgi:RNA polymerase sigma-70 factor (ECF subfamily)
MEIGPAVTQGDDYGELYREYLPRILNYVRLRVNSEDLAQDLTAEVFERAAAKQHTLRKRGAFGGWLFRIARNVVAGYYRRRQPTIPLEYAGDLTSSAPSPPEVVMQQEEVARLRAAIGSLSEREQEIVRLKFGGGLGNKEIARVMGLRAGHVGVLVYRALRKLRAILKDEEFNRRGHRGRREGEGAVKG